MTGDASVSFLSPLSHASPSLTLASEPEASLAPAMAEVEDFRFPKHLQNAVSCVSYFDTINIKAKSPRTGGDASKTHGLLNAHTFVLLACHKLATNLAPLCV